MNMYICLTFAMVMRLKPSSPQVWNDVKRADTSFQCLQQSMVTSKVTVSVSLIATDQSNRPV